MSAAESKLNRPQDRWPTSKWPDQAGKFYAYLMYHQWSFGPFDSEHELRAFVRAEDKRDRYWRYDGLALMEGHPNAATEGWPWPSVRYLDK